MPDRNGKIFYTSITSLSHISKLAGFEGKFQIIGGAKEEAGEELYGQIAGDFIRAAIHPADRAFQAFVFCSALTAGASLYARIRLKRKWKLLRVYFLGVLVLAAYYGGMLYLYLFTMPEEEAVRLAGFSRYACSGMALFAGMLLLCLVKDVENSFAVDIDERGAYRAYSSPGAKRRYQNAVLVTFLLGVNFFYSECSGLEVIRDGYEETLPGRVQALAGDAWPARGERRAGAVPGPGVRCRGGRCPAGKCDTFSGIFCGQKMWKCGISGNRKPGKQRSGKGNMTGYSGCPGNLSAVPRHR